MGWLEDIGEDISNDASELYNEITGFKPAQHIAEGLGRAVEAVTTSDDILEGLGKGASELYAGALNVTSDIAEALGMDMGNVPEYTGESATAFWGGLAGDEAAKETPVTTRKGEETTIGNVAGYGEMEGIATDVKTGVEGLAKAASLGALTEGWNMLNQGMGHTLSSTANTIEQALNIDNRRDI